MFLFLVRIKKMNKFILNGVMFTLALLSSSSYANDMKEMYYWSNAKGLVKAEHCKIETANDTNLKIVDDDSNKPIALERNEGNSNLNIINKSLVKIIDNNNKSDDKSVEMVSVNSLIFKKPFGFLGMISNKPWKAQAYRGDQGTVNQSHLKSIKDYTIKINSADKDISKGDNWRVYHNETYVKLNCPEFVDKKDYVIFNVYSESSKALISRVGVSASETELFKDVLIFENTNPIAESLNELISSFNESILIPDTKSDNEKLEIPPIAEEIIEENEENEENNEEVYIQKGMDTIICTQQDYINVRNENLSKVLFTAKSKERVKVFQGWGKNKFEGVVNGIKYTFSKVEFLDKEDQTQKIGYIVAMYIKAKSDCKDLAPPKETNLDPKDTSFSGLNDKKCCNYPLGNLPREPYTVKTPSFGARRSKGKRAHAAVDLYRYINEPVYSVAPGVVIRDLYFFYEGLFALEVRHSGGFVVRYGEITGKRVDNISLGKEVKMGSRVGYVGKANSGCCVPMLHFELYSGKLKGPLKHNGPDKDGIVYNRRRDLMNPTKYMLKWQKDKFKK